MEKLIDVDELRAICEDEVFERYLFKDVCPWETEYYLSDNSKAWRKPEIKLDRGTLVPCAGVDPTTRLSRNKWLSGMANRELAYRRMLLTIGRTTPNLERGIVSPIGVMTMAIAKSTWDALIFSDQSKLISHTELLGKKIGAVDSARNAGERTLSNELNAITDPKVERRLINVTEPTFKTRFTKLYYFRAEGRYEFAVTQIGNTLTRLVLNIGVNPDTSNVQATLYTWCVVLDHSYTSFIRTVELVNETLPIGDKLELDFDENTIRGLHDREVKTENLVHLFSPPSN